MNNVLIRSYSPRFTRLIGKKLAGFLQPPFDILLSGDLGSGKTEFVRGFLSNWGHKIVRSPSFTVVNSFETPLYTIHHIDLFRIKDREEILVRGIMDLLSEADSVRFIEWPELIKEFINSNRSLDIHIEITGKRERLLSLISESLHVIEKLKESLSPYEIR